MKKLLATVLAFAPLALAGLDDLHAPWNEILSTHVKGDRVDYAGVLADRAKLDGYIATLASQDSNAVKSASKNEQVAFYINAYNANVFRDIVNNPGAGSMASPQGALIANERNHVVAAESLSINGIARKVFAVNPDPLFWGLLNDGSLSAAPIQPQAITSANVASLAEQNTRAWLADTSRNVLNATTSKVAQIPFDFYRVKPEFRGFSGGMQGFLKKYGPDGCDPEKNRPTFFYNPNKNAPIPPPKPAKGGKKGKKK
jgi:hypothetical protein